MTNTEEPITFTQHQVLKAIPKGQVTMSLGEPGTWRHADGYVVTSSMRPLLERKWVVPEPTFTKGVRRVKLSAAGYAALSRATHKPPTKRGSR